MFSKLKGAGGGAAAGHSPLDTNPISQYYEVGKQTACAGPGLIWKIYDAVRKSDRKEASIFLFEKRLAEKLHKPKRKDTVCEVLRGSVRQLERFRHPRILQVLHSVEECNETLAFASEPILASLANILAYHEASGSGAGGAPTTGASHPNTVTRPPSHAKDYSFLDLEIKYGLLQLTEALSYLHYQHHMLHRHVCPASIFVNKRGVWKLGGLEFTERLNEADPTEPVPITPWTSRSSKLCQPDLDYIAPEVQLHSQICMQSDMFSLGMVITAIFNHGRPLMQANNSNTSFQRHLETLDEHVKMVVPDIPLPLREATVRLLNKDPKERPTAQLLTLIKYFTTDTVVTTLQFLDVIQMKDPQQKNAFYRQTLRDSLPYIPRKLWFQHVWPCLEAEMKQSEVLAAVLKPILLMIEHVGIEEYEMYIQESFRTVLTSPKTIQATVCLLENLHIILEKTQKDEARAEVLRVLYNAFESTTIQVQSAALFSVTNVADYIDEQAIRHMILPRTVSVFNQNTADLKITIAVLSCVERILDRLDRPLILDQVLPLLTEVRLSDPEIMYRVVCIYALLLRDKKYGLTVNHMATRVMPVLLPQTVNPQLNLEQFTMLLQVLREMLEQIDRNQRNKLKLDNMSLPSPERRPLRHLFSSDNMHVPPFNIPNLRVEQRKTSSAEDMARKNSTGSYSGILGGWWFGGSSNSPDSNFLRVQNALPIRRLSDNTLMTPKIRVAHSCASSPGGSPGGLPIRRHSSIGPQERRGSSTNLSPPTLARSMIGGSMPNTSSSTPFLSSSMSSLRSRRPSACLGGSQGSGLLQQLGTGMVRQFTGSPMGSPMGSVGSHMGSGSPQHPGNGRAHSSVPSPPHVRTILGVWLGEELTRPALLVAVDRRRRPRRPWRRGHARSSSFSLRSTAPSAATRRPAHACLASLERGGAAAATPVDTLVYIASRYMAAFFLRYFYFLFAMCGGLCPNHVT
ncbi:SCY1-like protein 2 isoform X3 [Frankliniella occidentalis]|uniref:SCY1-like protein 2 isoform X3 n=1 Tax=Frankliniella occidentalis TaxID=133901 RepID=A0A9C6X4F0_FRAOC|nr:SCY1-like protein 2 isoform X3 [Frankliniella occidentalis]